MTKSSKRIMLATGAGLLIALGISAGAWASAQNTNQDPGSFSQRRMGPPGPGRGLGPGDGPFGMLRMFGARLNLTDTQRDQLKSIAAAHKDEWTALADRSRAAHQALRDAVTADTLDESLIRAKAADVAAVDADVAVLSARAHAEAWQILTPEQQTQARQFKAAAANRIRERR